jgi:hypothetical protein
MRMVSVMVYELGKLLDACRRDPVPLLDCEEMVRRFKLD